MDRYIHRRGIDGPTKREMIDRQTGENGSKSMTESESKRKTKRAQEEPHNFPLRTLTKWI